MSNALKRPTNGLHKKKIETQNSIALAACWQSALNCIPSWEVVLRGQHRGAIVLVVHCRAHLPPCPRLCISDGSTSLSLFLHLSRPLACVPSCTEEWFDTFTLNDRKDDQQDNRGREILERVDLLATRCTCTPGRLFRSGPVVICQFSLVCRYKLGKLL